MTLTQEHMNCGRNIASQDQRSESSQAMAGAVDGNLQAPGYQITFQAAVNALYDYTP